MQYSYIYVITQRVQNDKTSPKNKKNRTRRMFDANNQPC